MTKLRGPGVSAGYGCGAKPGAYLHLPLVQLRLVPPLQVRLALLSDLRPAPKREAEQQAPGLWTCLSLCVCVSEAVSICLSVYVYLCTSVCALKTASTRSVYLYLSVCVAEAVSVCLCTFLCLCLFVRPCLPLPCLNMHL